jgi:UDP-N-acetylglucosamine--N-acetylmuramyl-(pentapeptide) pyrophosphoryl-undecaprenol N-acetylglucosamine transferase
VGAPTRHGTIPPNETHGALATGSAADHTVIGGSVSRAAGPVLIMAGGTGGHVFPALAVAHVLRDRGVAVVWLGVPGSMESRLVPANGFPIEWVRVAGIRGKGLKAWLLAPAALIKAVAQAMGVLRRVRPRSVLGAGGYVSGPGGIAAWLLRVPLLIHEQNAIPGMTNRWLARLATQVLEAFPGSFAPRVHARAIGNPVRADIAAVAVPSVRFAGRESRSRLLVFGGSQGAQRLNFVVPQALARLPLQNRPQVRHQTGERGLDATRAAYADARVEADVLSFIDDMASAYAWADLAVCRAGAMTIAELQAAGVGAIFVPLPVATDDHQTKNAQVMVRSGAARLIQEPDLTPERLGEAIGELCVDRARLLKMAEAARGSRVIDAAARLADFCIAAGAQA